MRLQPPLPALAAPAPPPTPTSPPPLPAPAPPPTPTSPRELSCPPPEAALAADLERRVQQGVASTRTAAGPIEVTTICQELDGWLMSAAFHPSATDAYTVERELGNLRDGLAHTVWLVPRRGAAVWLQGWNPGPIYDFDGDGRAEASTIRYGAELEIWFSGGQQPSFSILQLTPYGPRPEDRWATWNGRIVRLANDEQGHLHAFGFRGGESRHEVLEAACGLTGPSQACSATFAGPLSRDPAADDDELHQRITAVQARRPKTATCTQLDDVAKARHALVIEQALLHRLDTGSGIVTPLEFAWGCVSHGAAPVVVHGDRGNDAGTAELWDLRNDKPALRQVVSWSAPDEWTDYHGLRISGHGDFDGDGAAESIVEELAGKPVAARFTVAIDGRTRELPSDFVIRAAEGKRDGIARLAPFVGPVGKAAPCEPVSPDACLPSGPPVGWWPMPGEVSWDWEHEPPQVLVWRGGRFAPVGRAALAAIISDTAAARTVAQTPALRP